MYIMTRKIKFPLEMADGFKVRNDLIELREHFDTKSIIRYFLSGKLEEWLKDRYYDKEAEEISRIDKNIDNLGEHLSRILGCSTNQDQLIDIVEMQRLNEKKNFICQKTEDAKIINNANITAITQKDLADLLDKNEPIIFLCGEKFSIPARIMHKKYVGILGKPSVEIEVNSDDELRERDIIFENVNLPWHKPQLMQYENKIIHNDEMEICQGEEQNNIYNYTVHPIINGLLDNGFNNYELRTLIKNFTAGNQVAVQQAIRIGLAYEEFMPLGIWEDGSEDAAYFVIELIKNYLENEEIH